MKKRILISFICLMLAVLLLPFSTLAAGGGLSASKTAVYRDDTFTVTLSVPAMTEKITDASFKVKFDKSVFEVTSYTAPAIAKADKMQSNVSESNANGFFSVPITALPVNLTLISVHIRLVTHLRSRAARHIKSMILRSYIAVSAV